VSALEYLVWAPVRFWKRMTGVRRWERRAISAEREIAALEGLLQHVEREVT
jgi:hypothetical protein